MGKARRVKGGRGFRNLPLYEQISDDRVAKSSKHIKIKEPKVSESGVVDSKLSRKILKEARLQQNELEEEEDIDTTSTSPGQPTKMGPKTTKLGPDGSDDSSGDEEDKDSDVDANNTYYEYVDVNKEDEQALEKFMNFDGPVRRTLADIIMEKINEKQTEMASRLSDRQSLQIPQLDNRVVEVFKGVRKILSKYRSGKLPKAFKVIPSLANWEQVLYITRPERWTAAAIYQATRIFTANLKDNMAQRFFNLVLLPRVRDDIIEYKRLNVHLYQALRKSLFKPGAFFKGILLPLCESGTCSLREAIIIGSVVAKNSIPVLHSAAALLKIAEMDYNGANSIFLRILLDKKYALPYRVVDAIVYHFIRFQMDKRELPVLWHQSFLTFVQRYKEDVSLEQKEALLELLKVHVHRSVTAEIRRELEYSKCREELEDATMETSTTTTSTKTTTTKSVSFSADML